MIIAADDYNFDYLKRLPIQKRRKGNPKSRSGVRYKDIIMAFDIETTRLKDIEQSIMYIWQWQIGKDTTIIGRTWEEFSRFIHKLKDCCGEKEWFVIYVHNLAYEFQFLKGIYPFRSDEVFATDNRKVLKCSMLDCLEFRCSYFHSNMSLDVFLDKMHVEHKKLTLDYSKIRYPWTELTEEEMAYCVNDVQGLTEALYVEFEHDGDNLYSVPLTSTGYVRRDAKKALRHTTLEYRQQQMPDWEVYELLFEAFRGGNTHANRWYAGHILEKVYSIDRSSSYPEVLVNHQFPVGHWFEEPNCTFEKLCKIVGRWGKAILMRVSFTNIELRDQFDGCPYLSRDKCRDVRDGIFDNGRILKASYIETTLTDIDWQIVMEHYKFEDCCPLKVYYSRYGYLPPTFIEEVIRYYRLKTELKGNDDLDILYTKAKNKLNSLYGMCAQNPVKQSVIFDIDSPEQFYVDESQDPRDLLLKANSKAYLNYAWGVWCTAWARYELQQGIDAAGPYFVYCDTDSVKAVRVLDVEKYNAEKERLAEINGGYAYDPKGNKHCMGVWEVDGIYNKFATLGAKKYVYTDEQDKLHITIAGVDKKKGALELEEHGGIEAFREGFVFRKAGGTEIVYNDKPDLPELDIDGHKLKITANAVIRDSSYTLGLTEEYRRIIESCEKLKYFKIKLKY